MPRAARRSASSAIGTAGTAANHNRNINHHHRDHSVAIAIDFDTDTDIENPPSLSQSFSDLDNNGTQARTREAAGAAAAASATTTTLVERISTLFSWIMNRNTQTASSSQSLQQPWFQGAPITKLLCMAWCLGHLVWTRGSSSSSSNNNNHHHHGPSGLFHFDFFFTSTGDLLLAILFLAHHLRRIERELASQRFIVWLLWQYAISMLLRLLLYITTTTNNNNNNNSTDIALFAELPYLWIGGVLYWLLTFPPRLHPRFITLAGVYPISEKGLYSIWGMYLLYARGIPEGILQGLVGYTACWLFFLPMMTTTTTATNTTTTTTNNTATGTGSTTTATTSSSSTMLFSWPGPLPASWMNRLPLESLSGILLLDPPPRVYAPLIAMNMRGVGSAIGGTDVPFAMAGQLPPFQQQQMQQQIQQQQQYRRRTARPIQPVTVPTIPIPPSQEAIDQLVAMGFEESRVREALQATNNNVERAADRLLING